VIDPPMAKVRDVKGVVGLEGVLVHNAVRRETFSTMVVRRVRVRGVGDDGGENLAPALEKPEHGNLAHRTPAAPAFAPAADVTPVGFHLAGKLIAGLSAGDETAQGHEEPDCRVALSPDQLRRRPCRGPASNSLINSLCCRGVSRLLR